MAGKSDMEMTVCDLRCGLPDCVAGKSDMTMKVSDLRCGLPEFVAGKSDMEMTNVPKNYFPADLLTDDRENLRNQTYC